MSYASQKQLKQVVEKIENKKASKTGVYPELVAGNLIDTKADPTPRVFSFDSSCGDASISGDGSATIKSIKGNTNVFNQMVKDSEYVDEVGNGVVSMNVPEHTISQRPSVLKTLGGHIEKDDTLTFRAGVLGNTRKWNQLCDLSSGTSFGYKQTVNGMEITFYDGYILCNGTSTDNIGIVKNANIIKDHKYINKGGKSNGFGRFDYYDPDIIYLETALADNVYYSITILSGTTYNNKKIPIYVVDLTAMYGTGNEPTDMNDERVQQLIAYAQSHPEYDEGSVRSVELNEVAYRNNLSPYNTYPQSQSVKINLPENCLLTFDFKINAYAPVFDLYKNGEMKAGYNTDDIQSRGKNNKFIMNLSNYDSIDFRARESSNFELSNVIISSASGSQSITFSQPISLNGLETKDELYSQVEGNELVTKKITRNDVLTINENTSISFESNVSGFIRISINQAMDTNIFKPLSKYLSDKFTYSQIDQSWSIKNTKDEGLNRMWLFFPLNYFANVDETKEWFRNNNVKVVYELATPTITEISRVPLTCDFEQVENVLFDSVLGSTELEKGVLKVQCTEKVVSIGVNIWDEEWEQGSYSVNNGIKVEWVNALRNKNYIKVIPNKDYYFLIPTANYYVYYYDSNYNYISYQKNTNQNIYIPSDVSYINFCTDNSYGATYNHDICINVSNDAINGTYIPYFSHTFPIPSSIQALEGYGWGVNETCYNYIDFERKKFVKRVGRVDLGTLNWTYYTDNGDNIFYITKAYVPSNFKQGGQIICSKYETRQTANVDNIYPEKVLVGRDTYHNQNLVVRDSNYTDVASFKAAMNGVILYYELAIAVETDLSDILTDEDAKIMVEAGGTVNFTAKTNANIGWNKDQYTIPLITTHKYLHKDRTNGTNDIKTGLSSLVVNSADNATGDNLINLTHMFGSGKEPATFDELCRIYPKLRGDIPYNEGKMVNYKGTSIRTVGFNQWDEEWEVGSFDSEGQPIQQSTIRSKNFIKIISNTTYYFHSGNNNWIVIYFYDSNKNFISTVERRNSAALTPENAMYMKFRMDTSYGTTYNHDVCINLVWSGYRNGEYEPHWNNTLDLSNITRIQNHATKSYIRAGSVEFSNEWLSLTSDGEALTPVVNKSYKIVSQGDYLNKIYFWNGTVYEEDTTGKNLLFPDGLLSVGDIHDEVFADHTIKRIGRVDLGTLDWTQGGDTGAWYIAIPDAKVGAKSISSHFSNAENGLYTNMNNLTGAFNSEQNIYYCKDERYTNLSTFKDAMSGVYLYYELANPITVTFDDNDDTGSANQLAPLDMSYKVADFGTEESLPENGNVIPEFAPLVADIIYSSDFTRQLVTMNKNYVSVESLDNLITIISSITGTTIEKVWDSENSRWNFVIRQGG